MEQEHLIDEIMDSVHNSLKKSRGYNCWNVMIITIKVAISSNVNNIKKKYVSIWDIRKENNVAAWFTWIMPTC